MPGNGKTSDRWSSADKFRVVLETAPLSEVEIAQYCRSKGIYPEQIRRVARGLRAGQRGA